jgi:hypothetical protein
LSTAGCSTIIFRIVGTVKMLLTRCALDQPESFCDVELFRWQQDGRHAARGLHELVHAGAVRQRRDHQRGVGLRRARHQVGEMIGDHERHLAMGQHRRLGAPRGAGGEEEPAGSS